MTEHTSLYRYSLEEAVRWNERDLWRESHKENCSCARAIEEAIKDGYHDNHLDGDIAKAVIERFGYDRVNWVLANTVRENMQDGRFSEDNKKWARTFHVPRDENRWHFSVSAHPGLANLFIDQARQAWQELGLFDFSHCESEQDGEIDYTGKVVAIRPDILKDQYKTPDDQLFLAEGGFGCHPNSRGRKVFGQFLKDGEETYYQRSELIGVVKDEHLPEWAKQKLSEMTASPEETEGITMKGLN